MGLIKEKVKFYDLLQVRFIENADMVHNQISLSKIYTLLVWSGISKKYRIEIINDLIEKGYLEKIKPRVFKIATIRKRKLS
jgi:hypothetical protein